MQRHHKAEGFKAVFPRGGIHVGNCFVDGEVQTGAWKTAIELKSDKDDLLRGLGQLLEALAHNSSNVEKRLSTSILKGRSENVAQMDG